MHDAQPCVALLERAPAFAQLAASVIQLTQLAAELVDVLPAYLIPDVAYGPLREGVLTIFTTHGALAARLRHLEPSLTRALQQRGWNVRAFKIRIRPQGIPADHRARPPKAARISPAGLSCLDALRQQLAPSPLRAALARLVARHRSVDKAPPHGE